MGIKRRYRLLLTYITLLQRSKYIFDIEIVCVEATIIFFSFQSSRWKPTDIVIPDFPQLKAKFVNPTQCSPITEQFLGWFVFRSEVTRVEFDHQLFDVSQTSWIGKYGVERTPLRTFNVHFQNVDCRLHNVDTTQSVCINPPFVRTAFHYSNVIRINLHR